MELFTDDLKLKHDKKGQCRNFVSFKKKEEEVNVGYR